MISEIQSQPLVSTGLQFNPSVTFVSNAATGNLIVVQGIHPVQADPQPVIFITDSQGNPYFQFGATLNSGVGYMTWLFYGQASSNGSLTVTVNYTVQVTSPVLNITEYHSDSGFGTQILNDGYNMESNMFGQAVISGDVEVTTDNDLLVVSFLWGVGLTSQTPPTLDTGWTLVQQSFGSVAYFTTAYHNVTTFGPYQFLAGLSTSSPWCAVIYAFIAPVTGGADTSPITFSTPCSSAVSSTFIEVFANRIPEDVYDSLSDQPGFVFNRFGPSYLNV